LGAEGRKLCGFNTPRKEPKFCSLTAEPGGYFSAQPTGSGARTFFGSTGAENFIRMHAFQPDPRICVLVIRYHSDGATPELPDWN